MTAAFTDLLLPLVALALGLFAIECFRMAVWLLRNPEEFERIRRDEKKRRRDRKLLRDWLSGKSSE